MTEVEEYTAWDDEEFRLGLKLRVFNFNLAKALDATGKTRLLKEDSDA